MENEIHVKLGEDHGGGSIKCCYEICNTAKPNNRDNTVIFSYAEEKDHHVNLASCLSPFCDQIDSLQTTLWE